MVIGIAEIILYLPESHSLKDKRQVVKSIKDKVRNRFNVAIAEVDDLDLWQKARLGVCSLGNDRRQVNGRLTWLSISSNGCRWRLIWIPK